MKKRVILILGIAILMIVLIGVFITMTPTNEADNVRFSNEYTSISADNIFVYKTEEDIIKILENGTGVIFLGFPECKWCQKYVVYLNEVAKDNGVEKINYFNISEIRKNNTDNYQKMVSILSDVLKSDDAYDDDGNLRIFVPTVVVVKKGEIVGFDDETAHDTKGYSDPSIYWENEDLEGLKERLKEMFKLLGPTYCIEECN